MSEFFRLRLLRLIEFLRLTLLPLIEFFWNSSVDLVSLVFSETDWSRLRRRLIAQLMWIERRLESLLPGSFKLEQPIKTLLLILLVAVLVLVLEREFGVEDLQESGELVVITRESPSRVNRPPPCTRTVIILPARNTNT